MSKVRRYNYDKVFVRKEVTYTKICKRCEKSFTFTTVGGGRARRYCTPCVPLAERERHKRGEASRREKAKLNGWPSNEKRKLIPYAGYDDGVVE